MDRPAMASVFRMRHLPASISGVRSLGRGQADPIFHSRQLGEAIQRQRLKDQLMFSLAVLEPPKPPVEKL